MITPGQISAILNAIEKDASLLDERAYSRRADAIDDLEYHILGNIENVKTDAETRAGLISRTEKAIATFNDIDEQLFIKLRLEIRSGECVGSAFKNMLEKYFSVMAIGHQSTPEYDNLDLFVNWLFPFNTIPQPAAIPEPEMISYQKTPARVVLEIVERCNFKNDDVFVDIGSGLGQVAMLVNLLAGIRTIGIEFDAAFCKYAQTCATWLNLNKVVFINSDARHADYSPGKVFFMFTPFRGVMLDDVLVRLRSTSAKFNIKLITYGPCTHEILKLDWLTLLHGDPADTYSPVFFVSK